MLRLLVCFAKWGGCKRNGVHLAGTSSPKRSGTSPQGCAGGDHVVDEQDHGGGRAANTDLGRFGKPLGPWPADLASGAAAAQAGVEFKTGVVRKARRDLASWVETAPEEPVGGWWDGNDRTKEEVGWGRCRDRLGRGVRKPET